MLALVENPYFQKQYNGEFGWANSLSNMFINNTQNKYIQLDVEIENDIIYPSMCREQYTKAFIGMRVINLKDCK